jgi:predicted DNA binding protein
MSAMRRLILEGPKDELSKIEGHSFLKKVRTLEVLQLLRQNKEELAMICRVELETDVSKVEDYVMLAVGTGDQVQVIEREKGGAYIVLVKHKTSQINAGRDVPWGRGGYVISREIREGMFKMTLLGSARQIRDALENLKRSGMHYRVVQLTDAKFSTDSPLNALTEKQRRVLISAYRLGYYDVPRKISSERLAKELKLHKSALAMHRRKAELRILAQILKE